MYRFRRHAAKACRLVSIKSQTGALLEQPFTRVLIPAPHGLIARSHQNPLHRAQPMAQTTSHRYSEPTALNSRRQSRVDPPWGKTEQREWGHWAYVFSPPNNSAGRTFVTCNLARAMQHLARRRRSGHQWNGVAIAASSSVLLLPGKPQTQRQCRLPSTDPAAHYQHNLDVHG